MAFYLEATRTMSQSHDFQLAAAREATVRNARMRSTSALGALASSKSVFRVCLNIGNMHDLALKQGPSGCGPTLRTSGLPSTLRLRSRR
jgi:hypothetical protein